jgi:hypothetical protein
MTLALERARELANRPPQGEGHQHQYHQPTKAGLVNQRPSRHHTWYPERRQQAYQRGQDHHSQQQSAQHCTVQCPCITVAVLTSQPDVDRQVGYIEISRDKTHR